MIQFVGDPEKDREYLTQKIIPLIQNIFNLNPHAKVRERGLRVTCYSKKMYEILTRDLNLPSGKKSQVVKIPEVFLNKNTIKNVLRGIFDRMV